MDTCFTATWSSFSFDPEVNRMKCPVVAIAALLTTPGMGYAQLLLRAGDSEIVQVAEVLPELARTTSVHFMDRSSCFGGDDVADFQLSDGSTLKLIIPCPLAWSVAALSEPALPFVIEVGQNGSEHTIEVVRKSALEKRLIELLEADLKDKKHSVKEAQIIAQLRDELETRRPSPEMKLALVWLLNIDQDPNAAPPEHKQFYDTWRNALIDERSSLIIGRTNPDSGQSLSSNPTPPFGAPLPFYLILLTLALIPLYVCLRRRAKPSESVTKPSHCDFPETKSLD